MAVALTIKNTFFAFSEETEVLETKRSTSVPRSWKPVSSPGCMLAEPTCKLAEPTFKLADRWADVSDCASTDDQETYLGASSSDSDGSSSAHGDVPPPPQPSSAELPRKTVLSLCDTISLETNRKVTKLNRKARLFEPISPPFPPDMRSVITAAETALRDHPKISNVHVSEGSLGSITTIVGTYPTGLSIFYLMRMLTIVKTAILDAAGKSAETYVIGYANEPFSNVGRSGFSMKMGMVPAEREASICWDTYQNGCCSRRSTCRWCHPSDAELAQVVVMLNEA